MDWVPRRRTFALDEDRVDREWRAASDEHPLVPFSVKNAAKSQRRQKEPPPLQTNNVTESRTTNTSWGGLDPLSAALQMDSDPLSVTSISSSRAVTEREQYPSNNVKRKSVSKSKEISFIGEDFEPWASKKTNIIGKYTTSDKLSLKSSFLTGGTVINRPAAAPGTVADKVKNRLEQLDQFDEGSVKEVLNLSQSEYMARISDLNTKMLDSWKNDQRVKALKIAIQSAKLLADVNGIKFYPGKFVLITDILDDFGRVVYERIRDKEESDLMSTAGTAKETCRNWFFKIASIRELIPRFYVECAILSTFSFLVPSERLTNEYSVILRRLTKMIRGIGDPLVATYARCYLCRVAVRLVPEDKSIFIENLRDFLVFSKQLTHPFVISQLNLQKVTLMDYNTIYMPAMDFIMQCIAYKATDDLLEEILQETNARNEGCPPLVLNSILSTFNPLFISGRAESLIEMVLRVDDSSAANFPKHLLIKNLGQCFLDSDPIWKNSTEQRRLTVLNNAWKCITRLKNPSEYILCVDIWIEFTVRYFGAREVNTILADIIKHMTPERAFETHYGQILSILNKVIGVKKSDFSVVFSMENLLKYLDLLQKDSVKVEGCKIIVDTFNRNFRTFSDSEKGMDSEVASISEYGDSQSLTTTDDRESGQGIMTTSDPVILNSVMSLCKIMHDSMDALALNDDKRQIADLIKSFIRKVNFHRDFEAQLNFYVECRANFSNLEPVIVYLIHCVLQLAVSTRSIVRGQHTKKTSAFVHSCVAYVYITIPSVDDTFARLQLYLDAAQVALLNSCIAQCEPLLKSAIVLVPQFPPHMETSDGKTRSTHSFMVNFVSQLLSFLLIVPDPMDQEPLYLFRGLLNAITGYHFDKSYDTECLLYFQMLQYLSVVDQPIYPYHIDGVESNDSLYGGDEKFLESVRELRNSVLDSVLEYLKKIGDERSLKRQSNLSLEFFCRVIALGDIPLMGKLALNLWNLCMKNRTLDDKQIEGAIDFVSRKWTARGDPILQQLIARMEKSAQSAREQF